MTEPLSSALRSTWRMRVATRSQGFLRYDLSCVLLRAGPGSADVFAFAWSEPNSVMRDSESEFRHVVVKADVHIHSPALSYSVWEAFPGSAV